MHPLGVDAARHTCSSFGPQALGVAGAGVLPLSEGACFTLSREELLPDALLTVLQVRPPRVPRGPGGGSCALRAPLRFRAAPPPPAAGTESRFVTKSARRVRPAAGTVDHS